MAMTDRVPDVLDALLDHQSRSWLSGKRPVIEELLEGVFLRHDAGAQLDLIYNEIVLREQLGERPQAEEYFTRYPHLRDQLELHFEVHSAMDDEVLTNTARIPDHAPVPEGKRKAAALPRYPNYEIHQLLRRAA